MFVILILLVVAWLWLSKTINPASALFTFFVVYLFITHISPSVMTPPGRYGDAYDSNSRAFCSIPPEDLPSDEYPEAVAEREVTSELGFPFMMVSKETTQGNLGLSDAGDVYCTAWVVYPLGIILNGIIFVGGAYFVVQHVKKSAKKSPKGN